MSWGGGKDCTCTESRLFQLFLDLFRVFFFFNDRWKTYSCAWNAEKKILPKGRLTEYITWTYHLRSTTFGKRSLWWVLHEKEGTLKAQRLEGKTEGLPTGKPNSGNPSYGVSLRESAHMEHLSQVNCFTWKVAYHATDKCWRVSESSRFARH